jgi:phospholipase D
MTVYKTRYKKKRLGFINFEAFKIKRGASIVSFLGGIGLGLLIAQHIPLMPPRQVTPEVWSGISINSPPAPVRACFTPDSRCTEGIVKAIQNAHSSIYVQAYGFTSHPIAQALVEAKKRGVDVRVILDKSQQTAKKSQIHLLLQNNIPVSIDSVSGIAHNKVMILDETHVLTGSFNFTAAADSRNAENVLIIQDKELARLYQDNWNRRAQLSRPYPGSL